MLDIYPANNDAVRVVNIAPSPRRRSGTIQVLLRLPARADDALDQQSKARGMTRSLYVAGLLLGNVNRTDVDTLADLGAALTEQRKIADDLQRAMDVLQALGVDATQSECAQAFAAIAALTQTPDRALSAIDALANEVLRRNDR